MASNSAVRKLDVCCNVRRTKNRIDVVFLRSCLFIVEDRSFINRAELTVESTGSIATYLAAFSHRAETLNNRNQTVYK